MKSHWDPAILKWTKSSNDCVLELHWPPLASRRVFLTCLFVFQIFHEQVISGLKMCFVLSLSATRSHKLSFQTISSTINSYCYSFVVNSIFLWNKLPLQVVSSSSFSTFKKHFVNGYFYDILVLYCMCVCIVFDVCTMYVLL